MNWITMLLPLGIEILKAYIKTSDSSKDDKVLEVVKDSCYYLSKNDNNDMTVNTADIVATHSMSEVSK